MLAWEFDFRVVSREQLYCQWAAGLHRNRPGIRTRDFRAEYLDSVPGQRIELATRDHPVGGESLRVQPSWRLMFTNSTLDTADNVILEDVAIMIFEDVDGAPRMAVNTRAHGTGAPVAARLVGMEQGWSENLLRLGAFLSATQKT